MALTLNIDGVFKIVTRYISILMCYICFILSEMSKLIAELIIFAMQIMVNDIFNIISKLDCFITNQYLT